ncbi:MAG: hypothetical protein WCP35_16075, partial [Verrucomicrobiota bacterium]
LAAADHRMDHPCEFVGGGCCGQGADEDELFGGGQRGTGDDIFLMDGESAPAAGIRVAIGAE